MAKRIILSALLITTMLAFQTVHATTDPTWSAAEWKGSLGSVKKDSSRLVTDVPFFTNPSSILQTYSIQNVVSVGIDESSPFFLQSDFTVSIPLKITKTTPGNVDSVFYDTLTITCKIGENQKYNSLQYIRFTNGAKVKVEITDTLNMHGANWDVAKVLEIKNELTVKRDYVFSCSTLIEGLTLAYFNPSLPKQDEVMASWDDPQNGQTEYDLEWTWIDESAWPLYKTGGNFDPEKVFADGSTRVSITQPSYKIPLLYDGSGKLFARVRPVQVKEDGQLIEGAWSYTGTGTSGTMVDFAFDGHENDLNWQASTSYAEEGKRKSVVQYFDGTLRGRQTVTKDNTTQTTIVAETFYDYQGRAVISVLPAPTINTIIQYAANFNKFVDEDGSDKAMYDKLSPMDGICSKPAAPLSNTSGASNYYSEANNFLSLGAGDPRKSDYDKFVPNGEGYVFAETRFTPDATGRIAAQGGVGPVHNLGSGHETKYFYESPAQSELDALFGTDAGYASHYFKNLVRDANGQYSVSYVDMQGRTVATALAGTGPGNMQTLNSQNPRITQRSLLDKETNNIIGTSIISTKSIVVPTGGTYTFNYELTPDKLGIEDCSSTNICYDCLYDLIFTIKSECGDEVTITGKPNPYIVRNFTLGEYLNNCSTNGGHSPGFSETFEAILAEGSYTITKELRLSTAAKDYYREEVFLPANTCKTKQDFIDEQYAILQAQANCDLTCESCNAALGTYANFKERFIAASGPFTEGQLTSLEPQIQAAYDEAKANCDRICASIPDDGFDAIRALRRIMEIDVTPITGQYAHLEGENTKYNIFNSQDLNAYEMLPQNPADWQHPLSWNNTTNILEPGGYRDENGNLDAVNATLSSMSKENFSSAFKPSWAASLLPHHPEYCKLITTERFLKPAYQFEANLNSKSTYASAAAAGYVTSILNLDPFFANSSAPGWSLRSTMLSKMNAYVPITPCPGVVSSITALSLWQVAQGAVFCRKNDPSCGAPDNQSECAMALPITPSTSPGTGCAADWDMVWKIYRTIYLSMRKLLIDQYLTGQCSSIDYADLISYGYIPRFPVAGATNSPLTEITNLSNLFASINAGDQSGATTASTALLEEQKDETCRSYATMWLNKLKECPDLSTSLTTADEEWLIDNLVAICKGGYDYNHPQGSSSLPPGAPGIYDNVNDVTYHEFSNVISTLLATKNIDVTTYCHPWMLEFPKPYTASPKIAMSAVITQPSDCECDVLKQLKDEFDVANYPGTFSSYLENEHGTMITQASLDVLLALCNKTYNCNFLPKPILLPPLLQCHTGNDYPKTCIECEDYNTLKANFQTEIGSTGPYEDPQDEAELQANQAFEDYVNYHTGFSKHWSEYIAFGKQCEEVPVISCSSLAWVVEQFHQEYPNAGSTIYCQQLFTNYFNSIFGTFYSYDYIRSLFKVCGLNPAICAPAVTCNSLRTLVNNFYDTYTDSIYRNSNCANLFRTYANLQLGTNYDYDQLDSLYNAVCGCSLNIASFPNCHLLTRVYNSFKTAYGPQAWKTDLNTDSIFTRYFHHYFGLDYGTYNYSALAGMYASCNSGPQDCAPVLANLFLPPYSCLTLQAVKANFSLQYDTLSGNCQLDFTDYFNTTLATEFSFNELKGIYQKACGEPLTICDSIVFSCDLLVRVSAEFRHDVVYGMGDCDSLFTNYFNTRFDTTLTYNNLVSLYSQVCDRIPVVCAQGVQITNAVQLNTVLAGFYQLYPDPGATLGGLCLETFTNYFNSYFGTTYDDSTIAAYYLSLTGHVLSVCESECDKYLAFLDDFNTKFSNLVIPYTVRRQLFYFLFNKKFPGVASDYDHIEVYAHCFDGLVPVPDNGITYSNYDPDLLLGMQHVYLLIHPYTAPSCTDFTAWFNSTNTGELTVSSLKARYESVLGAGSFDFCEEGSIGKEDGGLIGGGKGDYEYTPKLCGLNDPIFQPVEVNTDPCKDLHLLAEFRGEQLYQLYLENLRNTFDAAYLAKCLGAKDLESFNVIHGLNEYHYTLYYYDQAGQLVRTVPPEGVDLSKMADLSTLQSWMATVKTARETPGSSPQVPSHTLTTEYRYNTLGQVIAQKTPDAGESHFWYDALGRLVVSQNAEQAVAGTPKYSYTTYDELGRIDQVGQKAQSTAMTQLISRNQSSLNSWISNSSFPREQITRTVYDKSYFDGDEVLNPLLLVQRNLRNRVSYTQVFDEEPASTYAGTHRAATYYTYDIHGNVDTLLQDYNVGVMSDAGNRYKKIAYNYDLISGKVNRVIYQPDYYVHATHQWVSPPDQFYHQYEYDAENKLTTVLTSFDGVIWEKDARYQYYKHGPLARTILGQQQVQGIDYAYTLQGWLKGVNSTLVSDGSFDMGEDGKTGSANQHIARDAYGFGLHYFQDAAVSRYDYTPIGGSGLLPFADPAIGVISGGGAELFNGNIGAMSVNIPKLGNALLNFYYYDQLNRITANWTYTGLDAFNTWQSDWANYGESVAYDQNGNITSLSRIDGEGTVFDNLVYNYNTSGGKLVNNRLRHVDDLAGATAMTEDIEDQEANNYGYDQIGNLTKDVSEGIGTNGISWSVYGKILKVTRNGNDITYTYDASGNRISKTVGGVTTWYIRDASGNVMSIYEKGRSELNGGELTQSEVHLYGSSRLGIVTTKRNVENPFVAGGGMNTFERGNKFFELSNHLGNVLVTIADRKLGVDEDNDGLVDYYTADVSSAQDYYPFGMQMPGRKYNAEGYRYGFNGKEVDKDMNSLSAYDYGFRIYNPALGRFLSVDPLTESYPALTPYQFSSNSPIWAVDVDGLEASTVSGDGNPGIVMCKTPDDKDLPVPANAQVTKYSNGSSRLENSETTTISSKGSVEQFKIGNRTFTAYFDVSNGRFTQYKDDNLQPYSVTDYFDLDLGILGIGETFSALWQIGCGGTKMFIGGAIIMGSEGLATAPGWFLAAEGADEASAGLASLYTGHPTLTLRQQALENVDPHLGAAIDGVSAGFTLGYTYSSFSTINRISQVASSEAGVGEAAKTSTKLPTQIHHFATNKSKIFTPQMSQIADEFGLSLNGTWNKQALPHLGRHPNAYHNFVLDGMQKARAGAGGSQTEFLNLFNHYVKQPVIQNPGLLRKSGW